jgi:energy-coupling factor transporter ATP-binding protein EcfA2
MSALDGDPFGEWRPPRHQRCLTVLGSDVIFESDTPALLRLAAEAFAGIPAVHLPGAPRLRVRLRLAGSGATLATPPSSRLVAGAGLLCGSMDADNFALVAPRESAALVCASRSMLRSHPDLLRYELIEFAVLTLAARVNCLVPLHAACIARGGAGALLIGPSGAGKSTLGVLALHQGLDYVAEDSVFVDRRLRALAVPAFLHLRCDSLRDFEPRIAAVARHARVIRRRSGVRKFEIDLRGRRWRVAPDAQPLVTVVVLSKRRVTRGPLMRPLPTGRMLELLQREQPYAAQQPGWERFRRSVARLPAFELRRGAAPEESAHALRALLDDVGLRGGRA